MHNNSKHMHNQSKNTKANKTKQKKICFFYFFIFIFNFYDVMMTSSHHYSSHFPAEHGLVHEKKKISFLSKILGIFRQKTLRFPSSNIKPSI